MSCIDVDWISPKNASSISMNTSNSVPGYATIIPYFSTLSASSVGPSTTVTITGNLTLDGGIVNIRIVGFSFTGSACSCALLAGMPQFIPLTNKAFIIHVINNGTAASGCAILDTTGTITFYSTVTGSTWTTQGTVHECMLSYKP